MTFPTRLRQFDNCLNSSLADLIGSPSAAEMTALHGDISAHHGKLDTLGEDLDRIAARFAAMGFATEPLWVEELPAAVEPKGGLW